MPSEISCNVTAYSEWHSSQFEHSEELPLTLHQLRTDLLQVDRSQKEIWRTMNFDEEHDDFVSLYSGRRPKRLNITKGQTMEVSAVWCKDEIKSIEETSAGGHGPPSDLSADYHDAMCTNYCLVSDFLRTEVIKVSHCNCRELSTKNDQISFTKEGDFCLKNTGYLLCEQVNDLNVCDNCELEDFMCARREYNAIDIPLKGHGDQCNGGAILCSLLLSFAYLATLLY